MGADRDQHRRVGVQQPLVEGDPGDGGDHALRTAEQHLRTRRVAPLRDHAAAVPDRTAGSRARQQGAGDLPPRGTDYSVSGDTLSLTPAALTRLAGNRAYGVNATIEARFSQDVPWQISIISSDPPTQAASTGTTTSFAIPTQFRGDQLATMEARYVDGTPAGPANWTSFKEFWQHFQPDYSTNSIVLKPEFFTEVNEGTVTLTFHFWSGAQTTYRLTRSGSSVTGSTT
ncbi:hypothetical protein GCM10027615_38970 [Plantactinospora veratri]